MAEQVTEISVSRGADSTSEYFADDITEEQLGDIKQALITGDDLLLILGDEGSGKTTLLRQLDINSGLRIQCFCVSGTPRFSTMNLFAGMLEAFKQPVPDTLKSMLDQLYPCLQSMVSRNTLSVVVLDNAESVNTSELTQLLSGMLYINSQDETLLRVALAAPPEFEEKIPDLLPDGTDLPYSSLTIEAFSPQRGAAYIDFHLERAGHKGEFPFTDREMAVLIDESAGLPNALLAASADALNQRYGLIEDSLPAELRAQHSGSWLQTRLGKLALGLVASALIVAGLSLFLPATQPPSETASSLDNNDSPGAGTLRLVDQAQPSSLEQLESELSAAQPTTQTSLGSDTAKEQQSDLEIVSSQAGSTETTPAQNDSLQDVPGPESVTASADDAGLPMAESASAAAQMSDAIDTTETGPNSTNESDSNSDADGQAGSASGIDAGNQTSADADRVVTVSQNSESAPPVPSDTSVTASSTEDNAIADAAPSIADDALAELGVDSMTVSGARLPSDGQAFDDDGADNIETTGSDEPADALESPNWILLQDPGLFTVQMSASRDRASVVNFLRRANLPPPNSIFAFQRDGETWYALVHGLFSGITEARLAVEKMEPAALVNQPWIRSVGRVQERLQDN